MEHGITAPRGFKMAELRDLLRLTRLIRDEELRSKVREFIKNPVPSKLKLPREYTSLKIAPGSKRRHHSYPKGLIEHTVACTALALALCDVVEKVYRCDVDKDVVVSAAILHDIMKHLTYRVDAQGLYVMSELGEKLDHLSLLISELYLRSFPLSVIHAVAAHHGDAGPVLPRTIEALIVHLADFVDSMLNGKILDAAKAILRECLQLEAPLIDGSTAFKVVRAKQLGGCDAVKKLVKELKLEASGE